MRPVHLHVEGAASACCRNPRLKIVAATARDVDGVGEELAGRNPADVVSAAGVACGFDVHVARPVLTAVIARTGVVVRHALATVVEVFRLKRARDGPRHAAERCRYRPTR